MTNAEDLFARAVQNEETVLVAMGLTFDPRWFRGPMEKWNREAGRVWLDSFVRRFPTHRVVIVDHACELVLAAMAA